ncbi:MAG: hypothetical protein WBQ20_15305 [Methyloceanibacter sp.]
MDEIRLVWWNDCIAGAGVLGFQTPLAKILVRQLAPDQPKQKTKSKTYGYGCKGVASNGIYGRILSTLVLITRQIGNAVTQISQVILYVSPVRGRMLFRSRSTGIHRFLLTLLIEPSAANFLLAVTFIRAGLASL